MISRDAGFSREPYAIFRPALTLAIDDAERRWIAEVGDKDLPGPVWCVFPDPEVAVYVCDDLAAFVATLRERTCRGEMQAWLQDLTTQARTVWSRRHALALRPHEAHHSDRAIRGWLLGLPFDAYVYDLRAPERHAAGRMEWRARPVGSIAAAGCRCLRWLACRQKAGGHRTPERAQ